MSSVPSEVLRDILQPLDRWTLDNVQFTSRRFWRLIEERMSDVCLRQVSDACFAAPDISHGTSSIHIKGRPQPRTFYFYKDTSRMFSEFVHALQSSRVTDLSIYEIVFTPELVEVILQTSIVTGALSFQAHCDELTPTQFHQVLVHLSPTSLAINRCRTRACQITDELLRALSVNRVRRIMFPDLVPADGGSFGVTDDAIVNLCVQQDTQVDRQERNASWEYPLYIVGNGRFTKDLFKRLVEASSVSMRVRPLQIQVFPLRFVDDEDLREFAQHLSYRHRGHWKQLRIYDFPGEQQRALPAMHLQIVLCQFNRLMLIRAPRPSVLPNFFYESDE